MSGALVLFSGGQDSATCLAWALDRYDHVETIGFDYGQRHRAELSVRQTVMQGLQAFPAWAGKLGEDRVLDLGILGQISETALTQDMEIQTMASGLPNTFIPGRNLLFLTFAATVAYRRGLKHIVTGVCETDYSGYPDCRDDTIKALADNVGGRGLGIGSAVAPVWPPVGGGSAMDEGPGGVAAGSAPPAICAEAALTDGGRPPPDSSNGLYLA